MKPPLLAFLHRLSQHIQGGSSNTGNRGNEVLEGQTADQECENVRTQFRKAQRFLEELKPLVVKFGVDESMLPTPTHPAITYANALMGDNANGAVLANQHLKFHIFNRDD